jgi:hypothetical protein
MADAPVQGQQPIQAGNGEFNQLSFLVKQQLAKLSVGTLVEVKAVHPGAGLMVGFVDVLPLVNQVAGDGTAVPHATIYGVPYLRIQGGANAVIVDPVVGDIGMAMFADRDLSSVKATGAAASPASARRFSLADALYFGGWNLGVQPTAYVQVTQGGINLVLPDGTSIALTPGLCTINATATKVMGTLEVVGNTTLDKNLVVTQNFTFGGAFTGTGAAGAGNATLAGSLTATGEVKSGNHTAGGSSTGGPTG